MTPFDLKKFLTEQTDDPGERARLKAPHVNYMGPEKGPFKCGHCRFFSAAQGYCQHPEVRAHVEAAGCCNEFSPGGK